MKEYKDYCNVCSGINGHHDDRCAAVRGEAVDVAIGADVIFQARSPEGDPWVNVSLSDYRKAAQNGYETRIVTSSQLAHAADAPSEPSEPQQQTIACMDAWAASAQMPTYSELHSLTEQYDALIRKICFQYAAGGYNSDGFMAPKSADLKLRWIIDEAYNAKSRAADALDSQPTEPACPTCGGSKVDPGGLPICRTCAASQPQPARQSIGDDDEFLCLLHKWEHEGPRARVANFRVLCVYINNLIDNAADSRASAAPVAAITPDTGPFTLAQRMPPKNVEVLVCAKIGTNTPRWWIDEWYDEDGESGWGNGVGDDETIHWHPLPPAPQQEGSEAGNG